MKTPEALSKERRLIRLARLAKSVDEFIRCAARFPKFYGFPGQGAIKDYAELYGQIHRGRP